MARYRRRLLLKVAALFHRVLYDMARRRNMSLRALRPNELSLRRTNPLRRNWLRQCAIPLTLAPMVGHIGRGFRPRKARPWQPVLDGLGRPRATSLRPFWDRLSRIWLLRAARLEGFCN